MMFESLLFSFIISTCIEINDGMNYELEEDEPDSYFWTDDFITDPNSPLPGTPANVDSNEGPSSTNTDQKVNEQQAKDKFEEEYPEPMHYYRWQDLRNNAYNNSWGTLCFELWKNSVLTKKCGARILPYYRTYFSNYVVVGRTDQVKNYFDILRCVCPFKGRLVGSERHNSDRYFFITQSQQHQQYYYIMRYKGKYKLEVFDMRKAEYNPRQAEFDRKLYIQTE